MLNPLYPEFLLPNKLTIRSLYTVSLRTFGDQYVFTGEAHDFSEFVCILDGRAGITADSHLYKLNAGQCVLHVPNEYHTIWSDGVPTKVLILSFGSIGIPECTTGIFGLTAQELDELTDIFHKLVALLQIKGVNVEGIRDDKEDEVAILIKRLEILLLNVFIPSRANTEHIRDASAETFKNIVDCMQSLIYETPSIDEIARKCNLSVSHVGKIVVRYTGHSAMEYFTSLKMKRALELLKSGQSVKSTAYTLGYNDPSYFSKVFKKHTNAVPIQYSKKSPHTRTQT